MELETAQALARLGMIPTRTNDYGQDFGSRDEGDGEDDMGSSLRDTSPDFFERIKSGVGIGALPAGRTRKGPQRLLDQGELNLGRLVEVPPNQSIDFSGIPIRVLDLRSNSELAQFATVSFSVLPTTEQIFDFNAYGGPLVGIIEFGNGSGVSIVEIDIKRGFLPYNAGPGLNWQTAGHTEKILISPYSCSQISVPGSSIRVYVKNDANYRPYPPTVPPTDTISGVLNPTKTPMRVMAHVSYGPRPATFGATRTIWLMRGGRTPDPLSPDRLLNTAIPPLARSFYVQRTSGFGASMPAVRVVIQGSVGDINVTDIPLDVESPVVPLSGMAEQLSIEFTGPRTVATDLCIVYNIGA